MGTQAKAMQEPPKDSTLPLKIFGAEIPLPQWAVSIIAVFVIAAVPAFLIISLIHMQKDNQTVQDLQKSRENQEKIQSQLDQAQKQLQESQEKQRVAEESYSETIKHTGEKADWVHRDAKLIVTHYASDGCLSVLRLLNNQIKWEKDPALDARQVPPPVANAAGPGQSGTSFEQPPAADIHGVKFSHSGIPGQLRLVDLNIVSPGRAPQAAFTQAHASSMMGQCLNPHPGNFTSSNGTVKGCWTQIWRKWPDGCTHFQWFNTCSSAWDADSSGRPRIHWTACNH
jgi:hypothetical protein